MVVFRSGCAWRCVSGPTAARFADRVGHKPLILIGITFSALGMFWFTFMLSETPHYWTEFVPATVMIGGGTWGCAIAMINGAAAATLHPAATCTPMIVR